jgi:alkanesulfonate monooxygenase SsuD/methylene tetrahydromethanopterin reductase-like flavin-dependent oxidoreductase (luciferase family)
MAAGALIQGHLLKQRLLKLPVPEKMASTIWATHAQGKGLDDMLELISDELLAEIGTVIAGTPAECIAGIDEMLRAAKSHCFDIIDIASPLGPDWDEAIDLNLPGNHSRAGAPFELLRRRVIAFQLNFLPTTCDGKGSHP